MKVYNDTSQADIGTETPSADRNVHFLRLLGMDEAQALLRNLGIERRRHDEGFGEIRV